MDLAHGSGCTASALREPEMGTRNPFSAKVQLKPSDVRGPRGMFDPKGETGVFAGYKA